MRNQKISEEFIASKKFLRDTLEHPIIQIFIDLFFKFTTFSLMYYGIQMWDHHDHLFPCQGFHEQ